ncbi:Rab7L4, Rab7-like protein [Monocercomonoides exilis]|uniref:Rab7L4, Rab7-like protein n=1 Tax=Monocercomonoides exilis TaxID=2049356 RepID=UPI00355981E6|nr:Rab7L4, Rab7-like protein [Monocercomonoides exilis]|eukprot:MONOS_16765.1-p1 / transcript=MONOS_16765.1 / gene=MONOS_16765 / organism=Monocercomonoides_exilis_PA203 / gene_product=Rab7L4, Rab7-like protein / transcript_product=Rab7L4, Rab7-like protein / location=Mono_scaffold01269:12917-13537(+) / protein_length=207 / sequence_SO=supercontig / SO=protein_coding / is_pseudo=false
MSETEEELKMKVNIIGEFGVGNTSLIQRYVNGYLNNYRSGLGVDFLIKHVSVDDKKIKAYFWDTYFSRRIKMIPSAYFRGSDVCALVFRLSSHDSFDCLKEMKKKIDGILASYSNDCPLILIGNGSDQWEHRAVNRFEVEDWCKKEGFCGYFETSAETGENVDEAFTELVRLGLDYHESKDIEAEEAVAEEPSAKNEKSSSKCFLM